MTKTSPTVLRNTIQLFLFAAALGCSGQSPPAQPAGVETPVLAQPAAAGAEVSLPAALKLVPADAAGFVHVRLADLRSSPSLAHIRDMLNKVSPEAWAAFERKYVPETSTIDTLTAILLGVETFGGTIGDPDYLSALLVVTTNKPYDRAQLEKVMGPGARQKQHKGRSYFSVEKDWSGFEFIDEPPS